MTAGQSSSPGQRQRRATQGFISINAEGATKRLNTPRHRNLEPNNYALLSRSLTVKIRPQIKWGNWLIGLSKWDRVVGFYFGPFSLWLEW